MNYYNEFDPKAAAWLRELIKQNLIAPGEVDERSITQVSPDDLRGFTQCHFFAGIGGWSYALRLAGWPDDRPVWTGSCPCQPFSVGATNGAKGQADERHLWPEFYRLIRECVPAIIFGEQVPAAISWGWWDEVCRDLEAIDYACGSSIAPACSVAADHERKRLFWAANSSRQRRERFEPDNRISFAVPEAFSVDGNQFTRARHIMEGRSVDLLPFDGLSVSMGRSILKCMGNAIIPQLAAHFIQAATEAIEENFNNQSQP